MMVFKKHNTRAFTLIELLAVLFLGGLLISLLAPMIGKRRPQESWEFVHSCFNQIATLARQEALAGRKTLRVVFEHVRNGQDSIFVEEEGQDPEHPEDEQRKRYSLLPTTYLETPVRLPQAWQIRAVYNGKINVLPDPQGQAYSYVIPDGMMQPVTVHLVKISDKMEELVIFELNPFLGVFHRGESSFKAAAS